RIRLGAEYREWLNSSDNWLGQKALAAESPTLLRIKFPLPGTVFYLDPDLPRHGSVIHLRAESSDKLQWQSDSLDLAEENGRQTAWLSEGRHRLSVFDPLTAAHAETWIDVRRR